MSAVLTSSFVEYDFRNVQHLFKLNQTGIEIARKIEIVIVIERQYKLVQTWPISKITHTEKPTCI